jgi:hypothetical protein
MSSLPSALNPALFAAVASLVSVLLSALASLLVLVPGLRPQDASRNVLMRALMYLLNLALVLGYCFVSSIIVPKDAVISLLLALGGGGAFAHILYTANSAAHVASSPVAPSANSAPSAAEVASSAAVALTAVQNAAAAS